MNGEAALGCSDAASFHASLGCEAVELDAVSGDETARGDPFGEGANESALALSRRGELDGDAPRKLGEAKPGEGRPSPFDRVGVCDPGAGEAGRASGVRERNEGMRVGV